MINSVYIHIPFCTTICSYCDFPKIYYNETCVDKYLSILEQEIKEKYKNDVIKTIYIGGGTPSSLSVSQLKKLFEILKIFNTSNDLEYTVECNLENLTIEKLLLMKEYKVNRLSIGIQTFNEKFYPFLNRKNGNINIINEAKKIGFDNINVDLIYAIPKENIKDLKNDLNKFLKLNINHISTYSLIIEDHTILSNNNIKNIDEELDEEMYKLICKTLKEHGFIHYEISNFSKPGYESKHNMVYWNNDKYYGFGMGSSGYIDNIRYTNTKSSSKYLDKKFIYEIEEIDEKKNMEYEMILGLRKLEGVSISKFEKKFNKKISDVFNIKKLIEEGKLIEENGYIKIPLEYLYISNSILINFIGDL
jgi:oxygen-independent coproporphyrinogen-3 oxidase